MRRTAIPNEPGPVELGGSGGHRGEYSSPPSLLPKSGFGIEMKI